MANTQHRLEGSDPPKRSDSALQRMQIDLIEKTGELAAARSDLETVKSELETVKADLAALKAAPPSAD